MARTPTERNTAIDYINRDIVNIKSELQNLSKLIRDGNGQPSLMQQTATLGNELAHFELEFSKELENLRSSINACRATHLEKDRLSWQFKTAVWVALITGLTSIFIHLSSRK
jgi:hypothetical protein